MANSTLDEAQIEDLLEYCGTSAPKYWKDGDALVCCPVHGESNPSMGVSVNKQVCHCFACGFAGGWADLLINSLPDEFNYNPDDTKSWSSAHREAEEFLANRYELELKFLDIHGIHVDRYENIKESKMSKKPKRNVLPDYTLAPFMSGKETYKYFFTRSGNFTKQNMVEFKIGRDLDNKTVTIPIFYEDGKLAGIIGRYISKKRKHNERYRIYDFKRGSLLYPMDKASPIKDTIVLVEGCFDAIRMFNVGYTNTYALMTNEMTYLQADIISDLASNVIYVGDNDSRGLESREKNIKLLKKHGVRVQYVKYPDHGKDVCDWSYDEIHTMIGSAGSFKSKIKRM